MKLIIPAAGLSTRFGLQRPKFLQTHPSGGTMLSRGIGGQLDLIDEIIVISLEEYFVDISSESFVEELTDQTKCKSRLILLQDRTTSMVETIYKGVSNLNEEFGFIVKDVDNYIDITDFLIEQTTHSNLIGYFNIGESHSVSHVGKSFVKVDTNNFLINIYEKILTGNLINTGLISFRSTSEFLSFAEPALNRRVSYLSDVIKLMLENGIIFKAHEIMNYLDWGTLKEWQAFKDSFATFFVDLDGTLIHNSHPLGMKSQSNWQSFNPISKNIDTLLEIQKHGRAQFIFTTSRSGKFHSELNNNLIHLGFRDFRLITDLFHSKRILINDFSDSNLFPTAIAVNISRDSANLSDFLYSQLKK